MGGNDLSTDLTLGVLAPTEAIRPADARSSHRESEGQPRRRSQAEDEDDDGDRTSPDAVDIPIHQLDHLA